MKMLIVVDMQNDFITGPLGTPEAKAIVPNVKKKIERYRKNRYKIVFTRDTHGMFYLNTPEGKKLPVEHCIKDTDGWQIGIEVAPDNYEFINKTSFGYADWKETFPDYYFNSEDDKIELIGVCTDICVVSNALILKATYPNANITVDASCCAGSTPENHKAALEVMKSCQINVIGE